MVRVQMPIDIRILPELDGEDNTHARNGDQVSKYDSDVENILL
jgi:hypothetical protein